MYENNRASLSPEQYFVTHIVVSIALWEEKQYREAEIYFQKSLLIRKQLEPRIEDIIPIIEKFTEVEIKYRIAKCMLENR